MYIQSFLLRITYVPYKPQSVDTLSAINYQVFRKNNATSYQSIAIAAVLGRPHIYLNKRHMNSYMWSCCIPILFLGEAK